MLSKEFEFHAPREVEQALELLAGSMGEKKVLAGGMSLMPVMNLGLSRPDAVISLNHVTGLDGVEESDATLRIGAMVRHDRIESDPLIARYCPLLLTAASVIGDVQVRHRGTIGGSAAHADPAADYLPVLVSAGASIEIARSGGRRTIPARDFFVDIMRTALGLDELLVGIEIPKLPDGSGSAYLRLARLEGSFPIVNAAAVVTNGSATIAIGGATGKPALVETASSDTPEQIEEAAAEACHDAFGDLSGTAAYRTSLARVYARRAFEAALERQARN